MGGTSSLIGRSSELAFLEEALGRAERGVGTSVLVSGEAGIGKTTLVDALATRAGVRGARVLWGRSWETRSQPAWWPLTQALGALDPIGADLLRRAGPALELVLTSTGDPTPGPDLETAPFAVGRSMSRLLRELGQSAPTLLVLDDLHAADMASLRVVSVLASEARGLRLMLVATARDGEPRDGRAAPFDEFVRLGKRLRVGRLDEPASRALLLGVAPALSALQAARALDAAEGNPLYLSEVGSLLASGGGTVPDGLREAIRARLERLPAQTRSLVGRIAVLGGDADIDTLGARADVIEPGLREQIIVWMDPRRLRLSHGLVRDVAYAEVEPALRRALHLAAAERLEAQPGDPATLTLVAFHRVTGLAACPSPDDGPLASRAAAAALTAANVALRRGAYEDAVRVLDHARSGLSAAPLSDSARIDLATERGRALLWSGCLDLGRAACDEAVRAADSAGDAAAFARAALARGSVFTFTEVDDGLVALLQAASSRMAGRDAALEARILARLAAAEQPALDPSGPIDLAFRSIALARQLGDPEILVRVLHDAMAAMMDYVDPRQRAAINAETRDLARRLGEPLIEHRAISRLVFDYVEIGDVDAADAAIDQVEALSRRMSHPQHQWRVRLMRAMRFATEGRFELADGEIERAVAFGGDDPRLRIPLLGCRLGRLRAAERPSDELALLDEERDAFAAIPHGETFFALMQCRCRVRLGDADGARRFLPTALRAFPYGDQLAASALAEVLASLGETEGAGGLSAFLSVRTDRFASWGPSFSFVDGPLAHAAGLLCARQGGHARAVHLLSDAVERLRSARARPLLARALLDLADVAGDTTGALRDEARVVATEFDLVGLAERLVRAPQSEPVRLLPLAPPFTLQADGDGWALTSRGRTLRLRDSRGLRILARLVARPGEEVHAIDLIEDRSAGATDTGDAGELLDGPARAAYRARLLDLREDLELAEEMNDLGTVERLRAEADALESELARAFAVGGRARRAGAAAERARSAVTHRVKDAIARISQHDPEIGAHLAWAVRTGSVCVYFPRLPVVTP